MANNNRDFLAISKVLEQIVSQSLCGRTDYIDIHTIGAGSHDATETTGTEFQRTVESIDKRRFVFGFDHRFHGLFRFGVVERRVNPLLCCCSALRNEFLIFHIALWQVLFVV